MSLNAWILRGALGAALAAVALAPWMEPGQTAEAATLTVTKTADTNDGTCDADCSLREAINAASSGDTVSLPAGNYGLTIAGAGEDAGATGDLDVAVDLTIQGAGSGVTVIDGNGVDRALDVASGSSLTLQDVTVRDGDAPGFEDGGGVRAASGILTLINVIVTSNVTSGGNGGGIAAAGSLVMTNTSVTGNSGNQGAGIVTGDLEMTSSHVDGNIGTDQGAGIWWCCGNATFTIEDSTVDNNESGDQGGGIFHCCGALQLTITNSSVSGNSAQDQGGGIFFCCGDKVESTLIVISDSAINDNTSTDQGGGLFSCCDNGAPIDIVITDTEISGNQADDDGGGIYDCCGNGSLTITGSVISENEAGDATFSGSQGGGIYSDSNALTITNTTVSGNTVFGDGGGVYSDSIDAVIEASTVSGNTAQSEDGGGGGIYNGATMLLLNSTVSGNTAQSDEGGGGGIHNDSEIEIVHATIADNNAGGFGDQIYNSDLLSLANTIISGSETNCSGGEEDSPNLTSLGNNTDSGTSCELSDPGDLENADLLLGALADNGGPTLTRALLAGSPAVDAAEGEWCLDEDQRGVARPVGPACDIGAYEGEGEEEPDPTPTAARTSPTAQASGGSRPAGARTATPTSAPPATETPAPISTVAGVSRGPAVIAAPNTGAGPGESDGRVWLLIIALASLSGLAAATGMATAMRRGR